MSIFENDQLWPEHEAEVEADFLLDQKQYLNNKDFSELVSAAREHYRRVFAGEEDADQLFLRFMDKLNSIVFPEGA